MQNYKTSSRFRIRLLAALSAGLLALTARAYGPMPFPADGDGLPDSRLPQLTERVEPTYPSELLAKRVEGTVWVALIVDSTGAPKKVRAFFSHHPQLESAAEAAVKQWKFTPGLACGGRAVSTQMVVQLHFTPPSPTP